MVARSEGLELDDYLDRLLEQERTLVRALARGGPADRDNRAVVATLLLIEADTERAVSAARGHMGRWCLADRTCRALTETQTDVPACRRDEPGEQTRVMPEDT